MIKTVKNIVHNDYYDVLFLVIEITTHCNLKCKMCFKQGLNKEVHKHMTFNEFKTVLNQVSPRIGVTFIGLGEPLTNPDFKKMLIECSRRSLDINFATNGMLLTDEWCKLFIELKLPKVSISVSGATKESYESIHVNGKFETVTNNIKRFSEIKQNMGVKYPMIRMDVVSMLCNIKELKDLVILAKSLGADEVSSLHPHPLTKEIGKEHLYNMTVEEAQTYYNDAIDEAEKLSIVLQLQPLIPNCKICKAPWISPYINVHKNVYACCVPGSEKEVVTQYHGDSVQKLDSNSLYFGNLDKTEFNEIWNGEEFNKYRKDCFKIFMDDFRKDWSRDEYKKLQEQNPTPKNPCKTCGVRFTEKKKKKWRV